MELKALHLQELGKASSSESDDLRPTFYHLCVWRVHVYTQVEA